MAKNTLLLANISVSYGIAPIVNDISYGVRKGETFGLMGLNGSGKTTLIKTILGLREQDGGEVSVFERGNTDRKSKKDMAYLPERFEPPWFLTGIEFIRFSLSLYGRSIDKEVIEESASSLALDPAFLYKRVQTYSKGMRQKLGIMATLLSDCSLLILDEPMSGLDPRARVYVKQALQKVKEEGRTIFLSSHILADMDEICDRVGILHGGEIIFEGTSEELRKLTGMDSLEHSFLHMIEG
jgi:ABC-2 type transport system ATP-binding protein